MKIEGTVALVTGGASGLGAATVRELIGAGGKAVILDRPQSDGAKLAAELGAGVCLRRRRRHQRERGGGRSPARHG